MDQNHCATRTQYPPDPPSAPPTPISLTKSPTSPRSEQEDGSRILVKTSLALIGAPSIPELGSSGPIMPNDDSPTVVENSELKEVSLAEFSDVVDSEEDNSVVHKEAKRSRRTLQPIPSREYNLRCRFQASDEADTTTQNVVTNATSEVREDGTPEEDDVAEESKGNDILVWMYGRG